MSRGSVFNVHRVDAIGPVANLPQLAALGPLDEPRDEMLIARSPDEMRPERAGDQLRSVRSQNELLGERLAVGIVGQPARRIGGRFIDAALIAAGKGDAGTARINQPAYAAIPARRDNISSPQRVDAVILPPRPPKAGDGGDVEDDVDPFTDPLNGSRVLDIALDRFDAERVELRIAMAGETAYAVATGN